ncbi:MAG: hypothetical protein INR73_22490 [Williamsia sp.]|nr:hypothetical protein [Williamsia sp.]
MKIILEQRKCAVSFALYLCTILLANLVSLHTSAQDLIKEEAATCKITLGNDVKRERIRSKLPAAVQDRTHELKSGQTGFFNRVSHLRPSQTVQIELSYPEGRAGEKVSVMVADGGKLDNGKRVKVVELDKQKKFSFGFQTTENAGIYRIILRKGFDSKVVQLWVGAEENSLQN